MMSEHRQQRIAVVAVPIPNRRDIGPLWLQRRNRFLPLRGEAVACFCRLKPRFCAVQQVVLDAGKIEQLARQLPERRVNDMRIAARGLKYHPEMVANNIGRQLSPTDGTADERPDEILGMPRCG